MRRKFKKLSLGALLFGTVSLSDEDVCRAVEYEGYATKQVSSEEIKLLVYEFYDFSRSNTISKRVNKINGNSCFKTRKSGSHR